MLFQVNNRTLVRDREKTYLTDAAAAAGTTLTVKAVDTNSMADDDYIIVGEIGTENAEVMQINGAVSDGTSLTIDQGGSGGLRYDHSIGEPVYRIDYNRIEFSRSATDDSGAGAVLATNEIQPDDERTRYEDTANTTGFGFVRFNNETTAAFSSYSDGIPYAGQSARSLAKLIDKVRTLLNEPSEEFIEDTEIIDALNDRQRGIAHERAWAFYERERSFSAVANQFAYDIPTTIKRGTIHTVMFDTQPLAPINRERWEQLHWDTDTSTTDPTHIHVWDDQIKIYPRPSSAAASTAIDDAAGITAAATSVTVDSTASFGRGDYFRFIIDSEVIYATGSTTTTFTGLLRGQEGTTAATHNDDATITERNIVYTGQDEPTDLTDLNDETPIPDPIALAEGAAADLALKLMREQLHDRLLARYTESMDNLRRRFTIKQTGRFSVVKPEQVTVRDFGNLRNPNDFPQNVG